jgi:hypothetical protein
MRSLALYYYKEVRSKIPKKLPEAVKQMRTDDAMDNKRRV